MKKHPPIKTYKSIPWFIACFALVSAIANLTTGIVILATYNTGGDIALGVLTLVFAVWGLAGSIVALVLVTRQNYLNQSQATFIAQVSHELRTPITSIKMYAETLQLKRFKNEEEEERLFIELNGAIERIESLTQQILETRKDTKQKKWPAIPAKDIVYSIIDNLSAHADYQGRIKTEICDEIPHLRLDAEGFRSAVNNLLINALTHGGDGEVLLRFYPSPQGAILEVEDHGAGISKDLIKKLFEPFQRGQDTTESGIPGFGLGLSIIKSFCKQHDAPILVRQASHGGSVFSLHLKG